MRFNIQEIQCSKECYVYFIHNPFKKEIKSNISTNTVYVHFQIHYNAPLQFLKFFRVW